MSSAQVYEYQEHLLQVPPSPLSGGENVLNGHGIARDAVGNLYFTFQPAQVAADTQVLVKFNPDGTNGTLLGEKGAVRTPSGGLRCYCDLSGPFLTA